VHARAERVRDPQSDVSASVSATVLTIGKVRGMRQDETRYWVGEISPAPLDVVELALAIVDDASDRWASERDDPDRKQQN
jgi:hypothetical protein